MLDKWQAQDTFWNSFGLSAWNELNVPEDEARAILLSGGMYITYQATTGSLNGQMQVAGSIWHRSNSWAKIMQKADEMGLTVDRQIPIKGGHVKFRKPVVNFAQPMSDPMDSQVRRILLTVEIEFLAE